MGTELAQDMTDHDAIGDDGAASEGSETGWEKLLGTVLFLGGLGFDVAGTDITVTIPVGLDKVAVVLGLVILAKFANIGRQAIIAFTAIALAVWAWAWLAPSADHTLHANFVNLREEAGLDAPRATRLVDRSGEKIRVDEDSEIDGWFLIETDAGERGWLFGAFIRGLDDYNVGETKDNSAAVLRDADGVPTGEVNRSTNRVLIVERDGDLFEILTASGTTRWVAADEFFDWS